jgi:UDP-N-acetylglucosamine acyltransferase
MKHLLQQLQQHVHHIAIDKIESVQSSNQIITIKNVSLSDPVFDPTHSLDTITFPQQALIDAHTQSGILLLLHSNYLEEHTYHISGIQSFSSLHTVVPGDQLRIETELNQSSNDTITFASRSYVDGTQCSEISFTIHQSNADTSSTFIHPTASVHASARLGQGVRIGPYCIVNEDVVIGDNTVLTAHVMIEKHASIGTNNTIQYGAVIGSAPQDVKYDGEISSVTIGDHNHIREYVTINRATGKDEVTSIGSHNMLLTNTHIGHNCVIGDNVTMANVVHIGGHAVIEDNATIGGLTGIHQFVRVGKGTMIGGYSRLIQDVPPFMLCDGNPAYVRNLNVIGCRRSGMDRQTISDLKQLYKLLYRSQLNTKKALAEFSPATESEEVAHLLNFLKQDTSRGISIKSSLVESVDA